MRIFAFRQTVSAAGEFGAVPVLPDVDVTQNFVYGLLVDDRPHLSFRIRPIADA